MKNLTKIFAIFSIIPLALVSLGLSAVKGTAPRYAAIQGIVFIDNNNNGILDNEENKSFLRDSEGNLILDGRGRPQMSDPGSLIDNRKVYIYQEDGDDADTYWDRVDDMDGAPQDASGSYYRESSTRARLRGGISVANSTDSWRGQVRFRVAIPEVGSKTYYVCGSMSPVFGINPSAMANMPIGSHAKVSDGSDFDDAANPEVNHENQTLVENNSPDRFDRYRNPIRQLPYCWEVVVESTYGNGKVTEIKRLDIPYAPAS